MLQRPFEGRKSQRSHSVRKGLDSCGKSCLKKNFLLEEMWHVEAAPYSK